MNISRAYLPVLTGLANGGAAYAVAALTGVVNPVAGVIAGVTLGIGSGACFQDGYKTKNATIKLIASSILGVAATTGALAYIGAPITFKATALLLGLTVAINPLIVLGTTSALISGLVLLGFANNPPRC